MAAIFAIVLILWVTEAVPVAVTSLLAVVLLPIFGVADLGTAFSTFISPVFFFVLAMFIIAQAFISSGLDRRFALWLLSKAGTDSRRVLVGLHGRHLSHLDHHVRRAGHRHLHGARARPVREDGACPGASRRSGRP